MIYGSAFCCLDEADINHQNIITNMVPRNVLTIKKKSQNTHGNKSERVIQRAELDTETVETGIIRTDISA